MQRLKLLLPHRFLQRRWLYASDIFCLDSITLLNVHLSLLLLRQKIIDVADANLRLLTFTYLRLIVFLFHLCFVSLEMFGLHIFLLLARVDLILLSNIATPWMQASLKSWLATILSFFHWLHRKAYNWFHLQLGRWRLRRKRARYEREVPLQERLERERRLEEINARIAAVPLDPSWTMPPRQYTRGGSRASLSTG